MASIERVSIRLAAFLVISCMLLFSGCPETPIATEILVVIDSDLTVGTELTQLDVAVFDRDGTAPIATRTFRLSADPTGATGKLPLSFSIAPAAQQSSRDIRVEVVGSGRVGAEGFEQQVVEQQAIVSFRPGRAQRLDFYLTRSCLQKLCREDAGLTCDPRTAACVAIPERMELPSSEGDGVGGYDGPTLGVPPLPPTGSIPPDACLDAGAAVSDAAAKQCESARVCPMGACAGGSCRAGPERWECVCPAGFVGSGTQRCERATPAPQASCAIPPEAQPADVSRPTSVVGTGTPASCTASAFVAAVAKGGVITFNCGPNPVTITLTEPARIFNDKGPQVVIDGGGKVTLSGGGRTRILYQNTCDPQQVVTTARCDDQEFPQLTVQNLTFEGGNASSTGEGGGAIYAQGGRLKVVNCHFRNNVCAPTGKSAAGGAIRTFQQYQNQPVYLVNSTFGGQAAWGNSCSSGGAIAATGVSFRIINSTFSFNKATGSAPPEANFLPGGGNGGAIAVDGNTFSVGICGSALEHNRANEGGGAISFVSNDGSGALTIENATLQSNVSGRYETSPGIFAAPDGMPSLTNVVVR